MERSDSWPADLPFNILTVGMPFYYLFQRGIYGYPIFHIPAYHNSLMDSNYGYPKIIMDILELWIS